MYYEDEELPAVMTFTEARDYLCLSRNTLLKLLHDGNLKGFKAGNQWRIKKDDMIEFTRKSE